MRRVDQDKVYFECQVCGHRFQANPNKLVKCPQCGSEDVERI
ncbi:zinc-ribbon domain-containing protein [Halorutilales archaeon Cl-col2-1]|nr:hypothetical protein [Halobacteria archaeon]